MATEEQQLAKLLQNCDDFLRTSQDNVRFRDWLVQQFNSGVGGAPNNTNLTQFARYFLSAIRQRTLPHLGALVASQAAPARSRYSTPSLPVQITEADKTTLSNSAPIPRTPPRRVTLETHKHALSTASTPNKADTFSVNKAFLVGAIDSSPSLLDHDFSNRSNPHNISTPKSHKKNRSTSNSFGGGSASSTPGSGEKQKRAVNSGNSLCLGDFLTIETQRNRHKKKGGQQQQTPKEHNSGKQPLAPKEQHSGGKQKKKHNDTIFNAGGDGNKPPSGKKTLKKAAVDGQTPTKEKTFDSKQQQQPEPDSPTPPQQVHLELVVALVHKDPHADSLDELSITEAEKTFALVRATLDKLAHMYSALIDLGLTTNVLQEISFLLKLLELGGANNTVMKNAVTDNATAVLSENLRTLQLASSPIDVLVDRENCIYFVIRTLQLQQQTLSLLDTKSLQTILNSTATHYLDRDSVNHLRSVYSMKVALEGQNNLQDTSIQFDAPTGNCYTIVYYQAEKDSRAHFTSDNEFGAFKRQRDLFYRVFKKWEKDHSNFASSFAHDLVRNVKQIFQQSENSVNITHFAKLFVAQLLASAKESTSQEEIDIDEKKLSALSERFKDTMTNTYRGENDFPGAQAFFRDFIAESESISFIEHLKIILYAELINLNDSTFEQTNLSESNTLGDDPGLLTADNEMVVRPDILFSMQILAKFLGFIVTLPYITDEVPMTIFLEKKQTLLRNLFQPYFNAHEHLQKAIKNKTLLITVPWLTQFLLMLDNVALQSDHYIPCLNLLFDLHIDIGLGRLKLMPTSAFIVKCCVGALLENKPVINDRYYTYRAERNLKPQTVEVVPDVDIMEMPDSLEGDFKESSVVKVIPATPPIDPNLESILKVVFPFTKFRSTITNAKTTESIEQQRRLALAKSKNEPIVNEVPAVTSQKKLMDAFMRCESTSNRRLVEYITERVYKSVVKDLQSKFIVPSKTVADCRVNAIKSTKYNEVLLSVSEIYNDARSAAFKLWDEEVCDLTTERIKQALDVLLPTDTKPVLKKVYATIIRKKALQLAQHWRKENVDHAKFYCADLSELTLNVCNANLKREEAAAAAEESDFQSYTSELKILHDEPSTSDLVYELQYWLHVTSMRLDLFQEGAPIIKFLKNLKKTFRNILPTIYYRLIGEKVLQLVQNVIMVRPEECTTELLDAAFAVWMAPEMVSSISEEGSNEIVNGQAYRIPFIFGEIVTLLFIRALRDRQECYDKLEKLLIRMINEKMTSIDYINDQFTSFLKIEFEPHIWYLISCMLMGVARATVGGSVDSSDNDGKSYLYMEALADLTRDIDEY